MGELTAVNSLLVMSVLKWENVARGDSACEKGRDARRKF